MDDLSSPLGDPGRSAKNELMNCEPLHQISIGSTIRRWLWLNDLNFPDAGHHPIPETARGLIADDGWVIFHRHQVVLAVPDEVHSYWHHELDSHQISSFACRIDESEWLTSFDQRHLSRCQHFVLDFRDYVLEVICEKLLFGSGAFVLQAAIEMHPELSDAYYWRAINRRKQGDQLFIEDLSKLANANGAFFQDTARELLQQVSPVQESPNKAVNPSGGSGGF
jgi:hypothetical protein